MLLDELSPTCGPVSLARDVYRKESAVHESSTSGGIFETAEDIVVLEPLQDNDRESPEHVPAPDDPAVVLLEAICSSLCASPEWAPGTEATHFLVFDAQQEA